MNIKILSQISLGLAISTTMISSPSFAQQNVDEIIVTARKVDESLQDVPVAVTALTRESIENLNISSIEDIARHTPGFSYSQAFGRATERPVVRGAGNILAGVQYGVEAGTSYFIDGQYYSGEISSLDMNMIERVEVVKGPQSALFGRNSYAGAINFITKPISDETQYDVLAEFAEHDTYTLYGAVRGPLSDNTGMSLSIRQYEYGGEYTNAFDGAMMGEEESKSVQLALRTEGDNGASLKLNIGYNEDQDGPRAFSLFKSDNNNCYPGYRSNNYYSGPSTNVNQYFCGVVPPASQGTQDTDGSNFMGVDRETFNIMLAADYEVGDTILSAKFAFRDEERRTGADSDHQLGASRFGFDPINAFFGAVPVQRPFTTSPFFSTNSINEYEDNQLEITLRSNNDSSLRWMVGAFIYEFSNEESSATLQAPAHAFASLNEIENEAIFAMFEYDVSDNLSLSAEGRFYDEEKSFADNNLNQSATFDGFAPRFVANYKVSDDTLLYASYSEGNKSGGVNGSSGARAGIPTYDEEEVEAIELGFKSTFMDGKLITNISAYKNEITNYQLTTPVTTGTGSVTSIASNQGDVEVNGLELELTAFPSDNLQMGLTYAYTDAEIVKGCDDMQFTLTSGGFLIAPFDINDTSTWNRPRVDANGDGIPDNDPDGRWTGAAADCSIAGKQVPMTSENQFSAYINADFPMENGLVMFINADLTYEDSKFVQVHNGFETGEATILGAQVGVRSDDWSLMLFGKNLTDEDSIPMGTRWFDVLQGSGTIPSAVDDGIDEAAFGPRAVFRSFRKGSQLGVKVSRRF